MPPLKNIFLSAILIFSLATALAQPPKKVNPKQPVAPKFIPPKVRTMLGGHADSATVTVDEGLQLVAFPLQISDNNKNKYGISSYQFLYRKGGVTEDEETGKISVSNTVVADLFRSSPLPPIWIKSISEQLKPGEELYFFDVVAKDNQGHFFFAPTLKIKIK